jgi:hypothetical protein
MECDDIYNSVIILDTQSKDSLSNRPIDNISAGQ